ncbi:MAG: hypothetical protein NDJ92_17020 [Thermoanaerobaculia bacterium]|nr:hypothetical protein [Thermoanaerobaculia bacterium]
MTKPYQSVLLASCMIAALAASGQLHAQATGSGNDPALIQKKSAFPLVPDKPMAVTVPPLGSRSQATGSALIVRAISEGAELNAPRMMALGVLGSQMLDGQQHVRLGYQSLFGALGRGCKLDAAARSEIRFAVATNNDDGTVDVPLPESSLIARREAMMYALAANLKSRLVLDDKGSPSSSFGGKRSKKDEILSRDLERAKSLVTELDAAGLHDANLIDLAGIVAAVLQRAGIKDAEPPQGAQPVAVYREALDMVGKIAKAGRDHAEILTILAQSMEAKGLEGCTDRFLAPHDAASHKKIVDAITKELVPPKPPSKPTKKKKN